MHREGEFTQQNSPGTTLEKIRTSHRRSKVWIRWWSGPGLKLSALEPFWLTFGRRSDPAQPPPSGPCRPRSRILLFQEVEGENPGFSWIQLLFSSFRCYNCNTTRAHVCVDQRDRDGEPLPARRRQADREVKREAAAGGSERPAPDPGPHPSPGGLRLRQRR